MFLRMTVAIAAIFFNGLLLASDWQVINEEGGVRVWKKSVPGTNLIAFKGTKVLPVAIGKVSHIIFNEDVDQKKKCCHVA